MNEKIICEKCGTEMVPIDETQPIGMTCPKCGWGWASTYIDPIVEDETIYNLFVQECTVTNESLKLISKITGLNLLQSKEKMQELPVKVFSGRATEIRDIIQKMDEVNLKYSTEPDFTY